MEREPRCGWRAAEVERELPGLGLVEAQATLAGALGRHSPPAVRGRLRELSDRWRGARAVTLRQEPVPAAYRMFFRQIGLDPDVRRTPIEAAVLERMFDGGFLSEGPLADVLTLALVDTCVPVWALDADTLDGPLGIRLSGERERLGTGEQGVELPAGTLVVADAACAVGVLFERLSEHHSPRARSERLRLFSVQVPGVPLLHVEEALWRACSTFEEVGVEREAG